MFVEMSRAAEEQAAREAPRATGGTDGIDWVAGAGGIAVGDWAKAASGNKAASAVVRMICFFIRFLCGISLKGDRREDDLLRRIGDAQ